MKKTAIRQTAERALEFLSQQRLEPTPGNYTLAFLHMAGSNPALRKAVSEITDMGVRLSQDEASQILEQFGGTAGDAVEPVDHSGEVRSMMLRLIDITSSTSKATSDFNRDLNTGMKQIAAEGPSSIVSLIANMVERTAQVERELARTSEEAEKLRQDLDSARNDAASDALTGLPNRRAVDAELERLAAEGKPRAIAFVDIDRFKSINDRFGHAVGDRVIKTVADIVAKTCKPNMVARWGGEEFIVVMPGLSLDKGLCCKNREA